MINILIAIAFALCSFEMFYTTFRINGINRTMINLPIEIFKISIPLINENDEVEAYFDKEVIEEKLKIYFDSTIPKFTSKYEISYFYYNPSDSSLCTSLKCQGVEVTCKATLSFNYKYERTMYYQIRKNAI